jgi:hypothetical protein
MISLLVVLNGCRSLRQAFFRELELNLYGKAIQEGVVFSEVVFLAH